MRSRLVRGAVLLVAIGLIAAACGDDKEGTTTTPGGTAARHGHV